MEQSWEKRRRVSACVVFLPESLCEGKQDAGRSCLVHCNCSAGQREGGVEEKKLVALPLRTLGAAGGRGPWNEVPLTLVLYLRFPFVGSSSFHSEGDWCQSETEHWDEASERITPKKLLHVTIMQDGRKKALKKT